MANIKTFIPKCFESKKLRIVLFALSVVFVFGIILLMNIKTPLLGDDLTYLYIFNSHERIHSVYDIFESQYEHYYTWGGRVVTHSIAQLLLMLDSTSADVINSLAFVFFILLIYLHINYKKPFSVSLFLGIFLLIWFLEPFAETTLWMTGSANYMWGTMIVLTFLLPYRFYKNEYNNKLISYPAIPLMLVLGVVAGWTNENIGAAMIFMIILFIIYYKINKWKTPLWAYAGLLGAISGYILMIIAPGNAIRAEGTETGLFHIVYRLFRHTQALLNHVGLLNLALIILLITFIKQDKITTKDKKQKIVLKTLIYMLGTLSAIYVMIFSPAFPDRTWFGIIALNIVALGLIVVNTKDLTIRYIKYGFIVFSLLLFVFNFYDVNKELNEVNQILSDREAMILKAKENGEKSVTISEYITRSKYVASDPTYSGPSMSKYYGIEVKYEHLTDTTKE